MIYRIVFALVVAGFVAGCRSDIHYQSQAIDRARKYVMDNRGDLTSEEINFIRFNAPVLLHAPVLGSAGGHNVKEHLSTELRQICVTWLIPGRDDLYMVFGVSGPRMDDWQPKRILIRDYDSHTPVLFAPAGAARSYAQNNGFYADMSSEDINTVRFTFPYLMRTAFELNFDPQGELDEVDVEKLRSGAAEKIQYSLVWLLNDGKAIVFAGLADRGMKNWNVRLVQIMDKTELDEYVVAVVMTPEQGLEALPASETAAEEN